MRLLLTRPLEQCASWKKRLEAQGHEVFLLPLIQIVPPKDSGVALREALKNVERYAGLVFTSQNAVRAVAPHLKNPPEKLQMIAVGKETQTLAQKMGWRVETPEKGEGVEGLTAFFAEKEIRGKKFLHPTAPIGKKELAAALARQGAKVTAVEAYQTLPSPVTAAQIRDVLQKGIDAIFFFSPSAVEVFFEKIAAADPLLKKRKWMAIGSTTARAIGAHGFQATIFRE